MLGRPVWELRVNQYQAVRSYEDDEIQNENLRCFNNNRSKNIRSYRNRLTTPDKVSHNENENYIDNNTRVTINVSGMKYETYERTLARLPDSLLGSPHKRSMYFNSLNNEFYFNRNRSAFDCILFYYQSGGVLVKPEGIPNEVFLEEVRFYELGKEAEEKLTGGPHRGADVLEEERCCNSFSSKLRKLCEPNDANGGSRLGGIIHLWCTFITIFFVIVLCIKTLPSLRETYDSNQCCDQTLTNTTTAHRKKAQGPTFFWSFSEKFCISWFALEYALRIFYTPNKIVYLLSALGIFDLMSFMPYLIVIVIQETTSDARFIPLQQLLVFLTFFSLFKLTRYSYGLQILLKTIQTSLKELILLLFCVEISLVLFSSMIYYFESQTESSDFSSIPATFWFTIVTMTTVGYGDMAPITPAGKLLSALCAVFGVCCVLAIPSTIIVTNFNFYYLKLRKPQKRSSGRTHPGQR